MSATLSQFPHPSQPKNTMQVLTQLRKNLSRNFHGFSVTIKPDDTELVGENWVVKEATKGAQVQAYGVFLRQKISQLVGKREEISQEIITFTEQLGAIRIYDKDTRKKIRATYHEAHKKWLAVKDMPVGSQYEVLGKDHKITLDEIHTLEEAYETALAEVNTLTQSHIERDLVEGRKQTLEGTLRSLEEEINSFEIALSQEDLRRQLDAVNIPQTSEMVTLQKTSEKSVVSLSRRNALTAAAVLMGMTAGVVLTFALSKKSTGSTTYQDVPEALLHGSDAIQERSLLGSGKEKIFTSLEQLKQHGDLARFEREVQGILDTDLKKVMGSENGGAFTSQIGRDVIYYSAQYDNTVLRIGVPDRDIQSSIEAYLKRMMKREQVGNILQADLNTSRFVSNRTPVSVGGNPRIQSQNAELFLQGMIQSSLAGVTESVKGRGYTLDTFAARVVSDGRGGQDSLEIPCSFNGHTYWMVFPLEDL